MLACSRQKFFKGPLAGKVKLLHLQVAAEPQMANLLSGFIYSSEGQPSSSDRTLP